MHVQCAMITYTVKPVLNGHARAPHSGLYREVVFENIWRRHLWDITEWPLNTGGL